MPVKRGRGSRRRIFGGQIPPTAPKTTGLTTPDSKIPEIPGAPEKPPKKEEGTKGGMLAYGGRRRRSTRRRSPKRRRSASRRRSPKKRSFRFW